MYVYDFDVFLTEQIVVDTASVLSFGKRCEDHGYSYDCTSGQKTHFVGSSKKIQCNTENYAPIVVPGLSTEPSSSATSASSTSVSQDTVRDDSMPCPATTRRGSTRSRSLGDQLRDSKETNNKTKNEDRDKARRTPLRDLPESFDEFTKISWTKKLPHQAMHPQAFLVNHFVKILREQWYRSRHIIFTHIPKDRCCEVCDKTEITRAPCRKRTGNQVPRAENSAISYQQITKFSVKNGNLETIRDTLSRYKIQRLSGTIISVQKKKPFKRRKGVYGSFSSCSTVAIRLGRNVVG